EAFQILHGQVRGATVTVTPAEGVSILPLSSTALLRMLMLPDLVGSQLKLHDERPPAGCHGPPSIETSTPASTPPPASAAVPARVLGVPTISPLGGVMAEAGGVVSVDAVAVTRPACRLPGWQPISAKRLTVACCTRISGAEEPSSWLASSPQDQRTVPEPKT